MGKYSYLISILQLYRWSKNTPSDPKNVEQIMSQYSPKYEITRRLLLDRIL